MNLSVIICTHNPRAETLAETLDSIRGQVIAEPAIDWELLVIDNASMPPLADRIDLSWHPDARVVREDRLGLTHARLRSYHEARGAIVLYVDDDNVLQPTYLAETMAAFANAPDLGAIGGRSLPRYEASPPDWFDACGIELACRDLGAESITASWHGKNARAYPDCAPIGAGMAIRREAYGSYVEAAGRNPIRLALGRRGDDLASGEDNDMILTLLGQGWSVAYLPQLSLEHIIPARRLTEAYLRDYAFSTNRTWVQVLAVHGIRPWKPVARWTLPLRKARAWLRQKPWRGPLERIAWNKARGTLEGRASLRGLAES